MATHPTKSSTVIPPNPDHQDLIGEIATARRHRGMDLSALEALKLIMRLNNSPKVQARALRLIALGVEADESLRMAREEVLAGENGRPGDHHPAAKFAARFLSPETQFAAGQLIGPAPATNKLEYRFRMPRVSLRGGKW